MNDAKGQMSIAATSSRLSPTETFYQLNPYTMITLELPDRSAIALYCSTFMGLNFLAVFGGSFDTLSLVVAILS